MADISKIQTLDGSIHDIKDATGRSMMIRDNLLNNWYFVGGGSQQGGGQFPINRRGQTVYGDSPQYTIDRWKITEDWSGVELLSDCLRIKGNSINGYGGIYQLSGQNLVGKIVAASILAKVYTPCKLITKNIDTTAGFELFSYSFVWTSSSRFMVSSVSGAAGAGNPIIDIIAAKLELGDTQTLAHQENGQWVLNEIPNYEEQLIRCKSSTADSTDAYANNPVAFSNDFVPIHATGTTNTTGATIYKDMLFYLNGTPVRAAQDIAQNATFTLGTNYSMQPKGWLNEMLSGLMPLQALQSGCSGWYERIGRIVVLNATVTKPDSDWSLFYQLPTPKDGELITLATVDGKSFLLTHDGFLQYRAGTFSETYTFSAAYISE